MKKLPNWVLTNKYPAVYDSESATSIEMVAKLYGTMQELVDEYNLMVEGVNKTIEEFTSGQIQSFEEFKIQISQQFQDFIDVIELKCESQDQVIADSLAAFKDELSNQFRELTNSVNNELNSMQSIIDSLDAYSKETIDKMFNDYVKIENLPSKLSQFENDYKGERCDNATLTGIWRLIDHEELSEEYVSSILPEGVGAKLLDIECIDNFGNYYKNLKIKDKYISTDHYGSFTIAGVKEDDTEIDLIRPGGHYDIFTSDFLADQSNLIYISVLRETTIDNSLSILQNIAIKYNSKFYIDNYHLNAQLERQSKQIEELKNNSGGSSIPDDRVYLDLSSELTQDNSVNELALKLKELGYLSENNVVYRFYLVIGSIVLPDLSVVIKYGGSYYGALSIINNSDYVAISKQDFNSTTLTISEYYYSKHYEVITLANVRDYSGVSSLEPKHSTLESGSSIQVSKDFNLYFTGECVANDIIDFKLGAGFHVQIIRVNTDCTLKFMIKGTLIESGKYLIETIILSGKDNVTLTEDEVYVYDVSYSLDSITYTLTGTGTGTLNVRY